jgi:hypothetical protein
MRGVQILHEGCTDTSCAAVTPACQHASLPLACRPPAVLRSASFRAAAAARLLLLCRWPEAGAASCLALPPAFDSSVCFSMARLRAVLRSSAAPALHGRRLCLQEHTHAQLASEGPHDGRSPAGAPDCLMAGVVAANMGA